MVLVNENFCQIGKNKNKNGIFLKIDLVMISFFEKPRLHCLSFLKRRLDIQKRCIQTLVDESGPAKTKNIAKNVVKPKHRK